MKSIPRASSRSAAKTAPDAKSKHAGQKIFLRTVIGIALMFAGYIGVNSILSFPPKNKTRDLAITPFDGKKAFAHLEALCKIGPRPSGSPGMTEQQKLLREHFEALGAKVSMQEFRARHPLDGSAVPMANMIVQWHPEKKDRILLCAHYDTRPFPDRDPDDPKGRFVGANDGASGAALLMELGRHFKTIASPYGVDFVLFDGEEFIFDIDTPLEFYFLGSKHFAENYKADPPPHRYRWGVLLDMVADKDLQIFHEEHSVSWKKGRDLVADIWGVAKRLKVREFIPRKKHLVNDDHLALNTIAQIPTCDIIDFDYPHWHTAQDVPENCSGESLAKVGGVVYEWLKSVKPPGK